MEVDVQINYFLILYIKRDFFLKKKIGYQGLAKKVVFHFDTS